MTLFKATYERINFSYKPTLRTSVDILIETDVDLEGSPHRYSGLDELLEEQHPGWCNDGNLPGWSSIMPDGKITKVERI